jgi:hypothetical protein
VVLEKSDHIGETKLPDKKLSITQYIIAIQLVLLVLLAIFYIINGIYPSLELVIGLMILIFIWRRSDRKMLLALLPLFILLLSFQSLRSYAHSLNHAQIHITDLIFVEKWLFHGWIPAYVAQTTVQKLPFSGVWLGLFNILYMSHFVNPLIVAVYLWNKQKKYYWQFIGGLIVITYIAFFCYIIFPAAPPWWATKYGFLLEQPVTLGYSFYPTLVEVAGPNPVAAMPSLHMAYPTFIALFFSQTLRKFRITIFALPIMVGLSTLVLGHHYVIDLLAGIFLSTVIYYSVGWVIHRFSLQSAEKQTNEQ